MKWVFVAFLFGFTTVCHAQQQQKQVTVDIMVMRDNFVIASIAAQKCNAYDRSKQDAHDRNFTIISKRASQVLATRSPGTDPAELRKQDLAHIEKLQDDTFNLLQNEGCKSDRVKALLRMHRVHETIRF
jgi:hypothetical protein